MNEDKLWVTTMVLIVIVFAIITSALILRGVPLKENCLTFTTNDPK